MNMLLKTLERAFDTYFENKYKDKSPNMTIYSDPQILSHYREELEKFSQFLVEEYQQALVDEQYWENRANRE